MQRLPHFDTTMYGEYVFDTGLNIVATHVWYYEYLNIQYSPDLMVTFL